jgi:hypothetical protein
MKVYVVITYYGEVTGVYSTKKRAEANVNPRAEKGFGDGIEEWIVDSTGRPA